MSDTKNMTIEERIKACARTFSILEVKDAPILVCAHELRKHLFDAAEQARREENEACAKIGEDYCCCSVSTSHHVAAAIRSRINPPKPVWCVHHAYLHNGNTHFAKDGKFWNFHPTSELPNYAPCCGAKRPTERR